MAGALTRNWVGEILTGLATPSRSSTHAVGSMSSPCSAGTYSALVADCTASRQPVLELAARQPVPQTSQRAARSACRLNPFSKMRSSASLCQPPRLLSAAACT